MKKALVTGGHNGIGAAIVAMLKTQCELVYSFDLESGNDVRDYWQVQGHIKALGNLDLVVNCAGICEQKNFAEQRPADFYDTIAVNLVGTMNVCHAAIPFLPNGDIINIASRAGVYGHAGLAAYCASKAGVLQFSEALALDLREYGIRVGCILPGTVATGLGGIHPIDDTQIQPVDIARAVVNMWNMPRNAAFGRVEIKPSLLK